MNEENKPFRLRITVLMSIARYSFLADAWCNFCSIWAGAYKQDKSTCARTWRSKRGGGLFLGEYGTEYLCAKVLTFNMIV